MISTFELLLGLRRFALLAEEAAGCTSDSRRGMSNQYAAVLIDDAENTFPDVMAGSPCCATGLGKGLVFGT